MKRLLFAAALALAVWPASAADDPKPNTLTPKEVQDGWLLLFDGESTFGWKIEGEAKVADGCLVLGGTKATKAMPTTRFGSCEVSFDYNWQGTKPPVFHLPGKALGGFAETARGKFKDSHKNLITDFSYPIWAFMIPEGTQLSLKNYKLRPKHLKDIFNGKDLTGWKEHPGKKSKFEVKDGVLNIKDGPGDLQTEGQWDDFILQLECISNGKHLNSGVFFRCQPDKYQQGYEAQVHNGFGEQPKEYKLEDYDPQTGKLSGTRTEKYLALDYGTGAIYRRQPARRQVSKDNEWFGMTVVAQGRHIGVWVNGVMVTDWTDNRAAADNGRNGFRAEKGPISLQGHDPTTDLSFRNFRIAELRIPAGDAPKKD